MYGTGYYLLIDAGAITDQDVNQADFTGIGDTTTWNFTVTADSTPPAVTVFDPADDAVDVVIDANFVMTFDEPVAAGSGNVEIRETVGDALFESIDITGGQVTVLGNTVTVDPNGTLGYARGYYLLMDAGAITDQEANPSDFAGIGDTTAWNFATLADTTPPGVTIAAPTDGDTVTGTIAIAGTASDNGVLSLVEVQVDGAAFSSAVGLASWTFNLDALTLSEGNPTITARATDGGGNTATTSIGINVDNPFAGVTRTGSAVAAGVGTAITITHGLSIGENDLVVAFVHPNGNQRVTDANGPSAFSEEIDEVGAGTNGHAVYSRIGSTSEPDTYQWTIPASNRWSVAIRVFQNVDTSDIWDVAPSAATRASGQGTTATAPSMTTGTDGALGILFAFSDTASQNFSNPTNGYGDELEGSTQAQASYIRAWPLAGATGPASVTLSSDDWMVYQLALRPIVLDTTPPVVTSFDPVDDAVKVAIDANLVVRFDENVAAGSGNIVITETSGGVFETVNVTSGQVTIVDDTVYHILVDAGAFTDVATNDHLGITDATAWNLATRAESTPPAVTSLDPVDGAVDVATNANLVVRFDENVVAGSGNIVITETGGGVFETVNVTSGQVTIVDDTVTIDPAGALAQSTDYHILVDAGALTDPATNDFSGITDATAWEFTTLLDTTLPGVAITSPAEGASVFSTVNVSGTALDNALWLLEVQVDGGTFSPAVGLAVWTFDLDVSALSFGTHTITARATDAGGNTATHSVSIIFTGLTTYYVDNTIPAASDVNAGTDPAFPWETIGKADTTLVAGDTVIVGPGGTYDEQAEPANSGTADNVVTYLAASGTRPKLRSFNMETKKYIVVNGFEITNDGMPPQPGDAGESIRINEMTGIKILNNYIHDTGGTAIHCNRFGSIGCSDVLIRGNIITNVGPNFQETPTDGRNNAITIWADDSLIENNDISHTEDFVNIHGFRNVVRGNDFHDSYIEETQDGIAHIDGIQSFCAGPAGTVNYLLIEGNTFHDSPSGHAFCPDRWHQWLRRTEHGDSEGKHDLQYWILQLHRGRQFGERGQLSEVLQQYVFRGRCCLFRRNPRYGVSDWRSWRLG